MSAQDHHVVIGLALSKVRGERFLRVFAIAAEPETVLETLATPGRRKARPSREGVIAGHRAAGVDGLFGS